jgi:hypothetical protein
MTTNTKIRTEDVLEILDIKIKTSATHAQIDVASGEFYDSVLSKIAARSPTLNEKNALDNSVSPSAGNPYVTLSELNASLGGAIPWRTIGPLGSGADYTGSDETPFLAAFATVPTCVWFYVMPAVYDFTTTVTVPDGVRLVGSVTSETILASSTGTTLVVGENTYVGFLLVLASFPGATAVDASSSVTVEFKNCMIASTSTGVTLDVTGAENLTVSDTALFFGNLSGSGLSGSILADLYVDASGTYGVDLDSPSDVSIWGSLFYAGTPRITSGTNVRVVGNHFNNGVTNATPVSSVLLRANTPSSNNNEDESLTYLLQYLGSPSSSQATPSYSSNFAGPQAQDLTARASAIDLLLQWIYEERNFSLIAESEPMTVSWNPTTAALSTSGNMLLVSAHRDGVWKMMALTSVNIPDGSFLYYVLDRSLSTSDITLTRNIAPLGSIPIDTNPPTGSPSNRQIWTLAYNLGGTLWWRGGGGSRFPSTGGYTGEYFIDGTSKSLLTYLGATDYNDSDPLYSNNFAGIQGESLTTRSGKIDTLLKRLFEHSNLSYFISSGGYFSSDVVGTLVLTGTLTFKLPHISGSITVATNSWVIADGSLLYFTWDQVALGAAAATVATTVPLPDAYPLTTKYFVAAMRVGSMFYLWDGSRIPMTGGRWPLSSPSRSVIQTAVASTLSNNTVWTNVSGTMHFLWENLAVAASTGIALNRNTLVNQTTPSVGLTNLADGEGLVITHTWNSGAAQNVTIQKVSLPLASTLEQNQFVWVQNRGGYLLFTGEF